MSVDTFAIEEIKTKMELYLSRIRPSENMRKHLDIGYRIDDRSVILFEILPLWTNPSERNEYDYAKATHVKSTNTWKVYWKKAKDHWQIYPSAPEASSLDDFLNMVDKDEFFLFKG